MYERTRKVELNLGYACNAKCPFCYYYDSVITKTNEHTLSTEQAKKLLRRAKKLGVLEIEFTGGEVTLRNDLLELIDYAKQKVGFKVVCLITNGIRLSKRKYVEALAGAGLDDVLFSVHGHNPQIHDDLTKVPRSFHRIMEAIDNAHDFGLHVRTNTVVCKTNYRYLDKIMKLLIDKRVDNINFVGFNPVIQATNIDIVKDVYVNYADAGREIVKAIRAHEADLPHVNVRYMPYCFVPGCEQYVTNLDQMTFDPDEWDNYVSFRLRKGVVVAGIAALVGLLNTPYLKSIIGLGWKGLRTAGLSRFYIFKDRVKAESCRRCAYNNVCDYLYTDYCKHYGFADVTPVEGPRVAHPAWIMDAAKTRRPGELPRKREPLEQPALAMPWVGGEIKCVSMHAEDQYSGAAGSDASAPDRIGPHDNGAPTTTGAS
jgi:MoaA/NifB/PqqE/SkfB family radical SAM enzyme